LKCSIVNTYDAYKRQFEIIFSDLYKKFSWLEQFLSPPDNETFERIRLKRPREEELHRALVFLATWLKDHFINKLKTNPELMKGYSEKDFHEAKGMGMGYSE
jgi:hypothetical protein